MHCNDIDRAPQEQREREKERATELDSWRDNGQ